MSVNKIDFKNERKYSLVAITICLSALTRAKKTDYVRTATGMRVKLGWTGGGGKGRLVPFFPQSNMISH